MSGNKCLKRSFMGKWDNNCQREKYILEYKRAVFRFQIRVMSHPARGRVWVHT